MHIVILGGGITGLSAAHYIRRNLPHAHITVVERDTRFGGKLLSDCLPMPNGACVVEGGAESFVTRKPEVWNLAHELGLQSKIVPAPNEARKIAVVSAGQLYPAPLDPKSFITSPLMSARGKLRMLAEPFVPAMRQPAGPMDDESLAHFVDRRLGREAREKFIGPILGGIYNTDPETQSLLTTAPVMRELEQHGSLVRGSLARMRQRRQQPRRPAFISFDGGAQVLVDALTHIDHVDMLRGVAAQTLEPTDQGWRVRLEDGVTLTANAVVLAVPANAATQILADAAPATAAQLRAIQHNHIGTISMVFREADLAGTDLRGIMIPRREKRPIDALTIARSPHPRVPAGYVIVKAFFGGGDSRTAELDEAAIGRVVRDELRRLLNIGAEPVAQRVYCWLNGFPQAAVGHLDLVDKAAQSLPAGLFLAGAAYRGIGVPDCIRQAQDAASKLTDFFAAGAR